MNRRNFFSLLSAGVAGLALEQAIPFGRVWSFPKKIVIEPVLRLGDRFKLASVLAINPLKYKTIELETTRAISYDWQGTVGTVEHWRVDKLKRIWFRRDIVHVDGRTYRGQEELTAFARIPMMIDYFPPSLRRPAHQPKLKAL
jgi:hypothetical protein